MSSPRDRKGKATKTSVMPARVVAKGKRGAKASAAPPVKKNPPAQAKPALSTAQKSTAQKKTAKAKSQPLSNSSASRLAGSPKAAPEKSNGVRPGIKVASPKSARETSAGPKPSAQRKAEVGKGAVRLSAAVVNGQPQSASNRSAAKQSAGAIQASPIKVLASTSLKMTKSSHGNSDESAPSPARPKPGKAARTADVVLPSGYRPTDSEPFMNERQRLYFRNKLVAWKEDIIRQNMETLQGLHEDSSQHADLADRATSETDRALELRARDRQRKLISKIDAAIARIEDGSYGYCEETGEPISLKRLDARPIATMSIEAQERHERRERVFRED